MDEFYTPPSHTHDFQRSQDLTYMQRYIWECECGAILDQDPNVE